MAEKCPKCGAEADEGASRRLEVFGNIRFPCGTRIVTETRTIPPASSDGVAYTEYAGVCESKDCLRRQRGALQAIVDKLAAFRFSFDARDQANGAYRDEVKALQREAAEAAKEKTHV